MSDLNLLINGLNLFFNFSSDQPISLCRFCRENDPPTEASPSRWARIIEVQASGFNHNDHHGNKYTGTNPGGLLRYVKHLRTRTLLGEKLEIQQAGSGLRVTSHYQFLGDLPAFKSWSVIENVEASPLLLEYISTFALTCGAYPPGGRWDESMQLHLADNAWCGECQWRSGTLKAFGFDQIYSSSAAIGFSLNRISVSNQGTWSTLGHLPMGALENLKSQRTLFWQIEHNGSWQWEIGDIDRHLYIRVAGPTFREGHWSKRLAVGQTFTTVPACIGLAAGDLTAALRILTECRRMTRRPHRTLKTLPIIFNDYMNCLSGDPTTEKLVPLIKQAANIGCEYFVIDAGWYAGLGESWWGTVGEWRESSARFPNGLIEVIALIREKGMVPGLWLEIEVMGIDCSLAKDLPDSWFFQRAGQRLIDHGRYQLDFRNPEVCKHADQIVDRLVHDYGVGYIKMDYNINGGPGTDFNADSLGDGLLEHNRAYLRWIESVFERLPDLVIENCSSGGLRMDYANLSLHSIQSVTDQTDYRLNAVIAAACASAVTPEQAAIWSYPLRDNDAEETILNMVNALLLRIHQSGAIHEISDRRRTLIKDALSLYKSFRHLIPDSLPYWPLGTPRLGDEWAAYGMDNADQNYLAVWRLSSSQAENSITIPGLAGFKTQAKCLYPASFDTSFRWNQATGVLDVTLPQMYSARLFIVEKVH